MHFIFIAGPNAGSCPFQLKTTSKPMGQQLTPQSCRSLLPTVWALLNQHSSNLKMQGDQMTVQMKVLVSLFDQWDKVGSSSAVKKVLLEVIAYLVLVCDTPTSYSNSWQTYSITFSSFKLETDPLYTGNFRLTAKLPALSNRPPSKRVKLFADWVLTLPRMAWELGATKPSTTQVLDSSFFFD